MLHVQTYQPDGFTECLITTFHWSLNKKTKLKYPIRCCHLNIYKPSCTIHLYKQLYSKKYVIKYLVAIIRVNCYVSITAIYYLFCNLSKFTKLSYMRGREYAWQIVRVVKEGRKTTWVHMCEIIPHAQAFSMFIICTFTLK